MQELDALHGVEAQSYLQGYTQGFESSKKKGYNHGFALGVSKSVGIQKKLAFIQAILTNIILNYKEDDDSLLIRKCKELIGLLDTSLNIPLENTKSLNVQELLRKIVAKYKVIRSLIATKLAKSGCTSVLVDLNDLEGELYDTNKKDDERNLAF